MLQSFCTHAQTNALEELDALVEVSLLAPASSGDM